MRRCERCGGPGPVIYDQRGGVYACEPCHSGHKGLAYWAPVTPGDFARLRDLSKQPLTPAESERLPPCPTSLAGEGWGGLGPPPGCQESKKKILGVPIVTDRSLAPGDWRLVPLARERTEGEQELDARRGSDPCVVLGRGGADPDGPPGGADG